MLQEDSNGENTFEIIDKKHDDSEKTDSSMSTSPFSIPSPPAGPQGGNLLSNLPPPSTLPDFMIVQPQVPPPSQLPPGLGPSQGAAAKLVTAAPVLSQFPRPEFSAAIPPSKGVPLGNFQGHTQAKLEDSGGQGGLLGWMKEAVSTGGILSKVAEKAKSSVDSLITTLDPQMTEFIYSGGDLEIAIVSSDQDVVVPIREAVYAVIGRAWVNNLEPPPSAHKFQAIGFDEAVKRAEEKISKVANKGPRISVEGLVMKQGDSYFHFDLLLLKDQEKNITLHTFTQATPIPVETFEKEAEKEIPGVSGICDTKEKLLATYLQVCKKDWQLDVGGVSKSEILFQAAKVLFNLLSSSSKILATAVWNLEAILDFCILRFTVQARTDLLITAYWETNAF